MTKENQMNITSRKDLGKLFQHHFLTGKGVEVGVEQGLNADNILNYWKGKIWLIDIWENPNFLFDCMNLHRDNKNVSFIRDKSTIAASNFVDNSLDFIYIDDDHSYNGIKSSFEAWFPKVRFGGIVSGHDYGENDCIGVKQFIDEYIKLHPEIEVNFTTDDFYVGERKDLQGLEYQTWWFIKK